ncbi:MAG: extracellular solute-binding protein [Clostridia bacterium]|nr:extracellular solute-binding protein [Clostridia bacterium]
MKSKRIYSFALAALLCAANLTACGGNAAGDDTTPAAGGTTAADTTEAAQWYASLGERNFEGATYRILARDETSNWSQSVLEMGLEVENGDVLNDAIYKRNRMVEDQYNLTLEITNDVKAHETSKNAILAGEDIADIVIVSLEACCSMNNQGMLYDLLQSPYLDFDQPYWDQNAKTDLAINGRLTFMTGDLTPMSGQGTWLMYFNKDLLEKYQLQSPYELVDNNQWTSDNMFNLAKKVASDLNGDTVIDDLDQYGLLVQNDDVQMFYQGFGERYTENNAEGIPELVVGTTNRSVDAFEKLSSFFADTDTTLCSNRFASKYTEYHTVSVQTPCFQEGRALFYPSGVLRLFQMRDYEIEFGVLPMPKYDEDQENYSHTVKVNWGSAACIPKTVSNFDDVSFVLEAMAAASLDTVTPAYYETTLGTKLMRDERSYDMLDIVMKSRSYDAIMFYNWGKLVAALNKVGAEGGEAFMSTIEAKRESIEAAITTTIEAMTE